MHSHPGQLRCPAERRAAPRAAMSLLVAVLAAGSQIDQLRAQEASPSNAPTPRVMEPFIADDEVVLTVGNVKVTAGEFKKIASALPPQFASLYNQMGAKAFADQYASLLGLSQEAEKREIDKSESFRLMYEFERRVVLAQVMANQITTTAASVSEEEVNYYYTTHEMEFEQLKVRGILIPISTRQTRASVGAPGTGVKPQYTEQMAQRRALQLRSMIMNGMVDMAAAAKTDSDHPTSAKGGDFGFVRRGELPPAVANTVFGLQVNQVSAPLRDKTGFYIFRVEAKRVQPLSEVKEGIRSALSIEKLNTYLMQIRETYPVTYHPTFFQAAEPEKSAPAGTPSGTPAGTKVTPPAAGRK